MMRILAEAYADANDAAYWYDRKRRGLGDESLAEVERSLMQVADNPESFPRYEPYLGEHQMCRCPVRRFPFSVIFVRRGSD